MTGGLAFVYPGQGSQRVGMGSSLRRSHPDLVLRWLSAAEAAAGLPLRRYCERGPREALTRTEIAQPALLALELALTEAAGRAGLRPHCVTGHSLGEYAAAVAAGALDPDAALALVAERGRLMAEVQETRPGGMAAVLGVARERVAALCTDVGGVAVANLNAPTQVVVSGALESVDELIAAIAADGAGRAVRLPAGAAFHSPAMEPVRARLAALMDEMQWHDAAVPLAANATGSLEVTAAGIRRALEAQTTAEVRWVDCVRAMNTAGAATFLELGPGHVLTGLVRQIADRVQAGAAESFDALEAFARGPAGGANAANAATRE